MKACNQCGKCCIKYGGGGLSVEEDELKMWAAFRPDIMSFVFDKKIWMDPSTHEPLTICPWLRLEEGPQKKYSCDIYTDRPNDCRYYPTSIEEMIRDECEMLEASDIQRPRQAQKKLDILMIDSRPPLAY